MQISYKIDCGRIRHPENLNHKNQIFTDAQEKIRVAQIVKKWK